MSKHVEERRRACYAKTAKPASGSHEGRRRSTGKRSKLVKSVLGVKYADCTSRTALIPKLKGFHGTKRRIRTRVTVR